MTCADNISAVQHEKRVCRVKCTLYTQGQEATKINGTTLTDSRGKNDLRTAWIYPRPSGPTAPSRRGDEPVTITRFHDSFPGPVPGTSSRPDQSASMAHHPLGVCQTAVLREPFTIFRTRVRSTLRTLEFWLSVRLNVNLHDDSTCRQYQSMFSISCQCQPMFLTCRFRSRRAGDSSLLCDSKRHSRPSSGDKASCSLQAFVHFPLSQMFHLHVSGIFDSPHFHDGQLTACHRLLHPQDLGMEMSHSLHSAP